MPVSFWNASAIFYALTYVVMFAIPLAGRRGVRLQADRAPRVVQVCAVSALLMTLLFLALSIVPIVQVESRLLFALKISSLVVALNAVGAAIFLLKRSRDGAHRDDL